MTATPPIKYHFILDPSALVAGIGNIKQWALNENCEFYIPYYTLQELDFLKKGNSLFAINARESVRFIDGAISGEDYNDFMSEEPSLNSTKKAQVKATFILEEPRDSPVDWKKTWRYKKRIPKVGEFPKKITGPGVFGAAYPGYSKLSESMKNNGKILNPNSHSNRDRSKNTKQISATTTEDELLARNQQLNTGSGDDSNNQQAYVPKRLKEMIASCVEQKRSSKTDWIIVCEDPTTTIWLDCFGLDVRHINQCQGMFDRDSNIEPTTSLYEYHNNSGKSNTSNKPRRRKDRFQDDLVEQFEDAEELENTVNANLGYHNSQTKIERIDTITYAPRRKGELWKP